MAKFRKKPVVIDAVQWTYDAESKSAIEELMGSQVELAKDGSAAFIIHTLEGDMRADIGDWIIKGVKGEFYPCKHDIFIATYEPAENAHVLPS